MGILDELFRRKPDDEFLPEYAKPEMTLQEVLAAAQALTPSVPKSDKPADPLRWAADAIGQNKDLPAPAFFMDPRSLSMRNIVHSGLNTAANWLDGTKDPRAVQDQDMIAPLGLGGMGGIVNSMTRPGRDFRIAEAMAREHPGASPVGDIPRFAPIRDASNPTGAAYVADFGSMPTAPRGPVNSNATPYAVMADNAKGSAPGTVINSLDMSEAARMQRAKEMGFREVPMYHGTAADFSQFDLARGGQVSGSRAGGEGVSITPQPAIANEFAFSAQRATGGDPRVMPLMYRADRPANLDVAGARNLEVAATLGEAFGGGYDAVRLKNYTTPGGQSGEVLVVRDPKQLRSTQAAFDPAKRDSAMLLAADNAKGSAPGTVINSLDMSEAARMQRAKEMGFDTEKTWYHGTDGAFDSFDPAKIGAIHGDYSNGFHMTRSPDEAASYGNAIMPLMSRVQNPYIMESARHHATAAHDLDRNFLFNEARKGGHDGILVRGRGGSENLVAFDPSAIRSTQAAFDPAKRDSANLLAASPRASAPGLAANSTQQPRDARELSEPALLELLRRLEEGA